MKLNQHVAVLIGWTVCVGTLWGFSESNQAEVHARAEFERTESDAKVVAMFAAPPPEPDTLPCFPGAVSKGANCLQTARLNVSTDTWPFKLWKITSLANSGDGSLRAILEDSITANAYNAVVPDTFGTITCIGVISPKAGVDNVYIAFQVGPGGGIAVDGCMLNLGENRSDWVIRYMRFQDKQTAAGINIQMIGGTNIYFDHITSRWAGGLNITISADTAAGTGTCSGSEDCITDGVTIANSMFYDSDLSPTPICALSGGNPEHSQPSHNVLWYQNFFMNCTHRNPVVGGDSVFIANNIMFNVKRDHGHMEEDARVDYVGNYAKRGAWTETGNGQSGSWMFSAEMDAPVGTQSIYAALNRHWRNGMVSSTPDDSAWRGSKRILAFYSTAEGATEGDTLPIAWKRGSAMPHDHFPWTVNDPSDSWRDALLALFGASRKVDSLGNWTFVTSTGANVRDTYDSTRIQNFIDSVSVNLGDGFDADTVTKPTMSSGAAIGDVDDDGLPDAYEKRVRGASDSTSLKRDSMTASDYLVWELYADGKLPDWDPAAGGLTPTYGTFPVRFVHFDTVYWDTVTSNPDTFGVPLDTLIFYWPSLDTVPVGTPWAPLLLDDSLHLLIVTAETLAASVKDSAWVDSVLTANTELCNDRGACAPAFPRTMTIPGVP